MFISSFEEHSDIFGIVQKYNNEWRNKFPFLKKFNLKYKERNGDIVWIYSYDNGNYHISLDIYSSNSWKIDFELTMKEDVSDITFIDDVYYKLSSLSYNSLIKELDMLNQKYKVV